MGRFDFETTIEASPEVVFEVLTDPERMPRWLPITEAIESVSGPLTEAGATFRQRGAPKIGRPGRVVEVEPPRALHLELKGGGERVNLWFELTQRADATHVRLDVTVDNAPPVLGPLLDRVGAARLDRRMWRPALESLKREAELDRVVARAGDLHALHGGGIVRVGHVIEVDERWVHLRLLPGTWKKVPATAAELDVPPRAPKDAFGVRPLEPTLRDIVSLTRRGSGAVLVDGGFGLGHLPLTHATFRAAEPRRLPFDVAGAADPTRVEVWRQGSGVAFGDLVEPSAGAYYSFALQAMGVEAIGFGILKLLKTQFRGVHVRVYSNVFLERPRAVEESILEMEGIDLEALQDSAAAERPLDRPFGIGHLPLSHGTFGSWQPEFIEMTLVQPDELRGYEDWKRQKGGFF